MDNRFDQKEQDAVLNVIKSGDLSRFFANFDGGEQVRNFEREFAEYLGSKYAISVSNGTVALEVALASLGIKPGDEVITTPLTFIATATAILRVGAKPVFADIDPETLNMDEFFVEDKITKKTRAIISVSLLGKPARVQYLKSVADEHEIYLLEDAAQALGAEYLDFDVVGNKVTVHVPKKIGTAGDISTFSFQESKTITTLGEGGMIATDNEKLANLCKHIRNHGNTYGTLTMEQPCTNARMTEAQAAFGKAQLTKLDEFILIQRENAKALFDNIKHLNPTYTEMDSTYYLIPFVLDKIYAGENRLTREKFVEQCKEAGISKGRPGANIGYYKKLIYDNPIFAKYKPKHGCINAEWARDNIILFDIHRWSRTPEDMIKTAEAINKITDGGH